MTYTVASGDRVRAWASDLGVRPDDFNLEYETYLAIPGVTKLINHWRFTVKHRVLRSHRDAFYRLIGDEHNTAGVMFERVCAYYCLKYNKSIRMPVGM